MINNKEKEEWQTNMEMQSSLKYYRKYKKKIGEQKLWENNRKQTIVRFFKVGPSLQKIKQVLMVIGFVITVGKQKLVNTSSNTVKTMNRLDINGVLLMT